MTTLYVTEPRALVRKDGDTLTVQIPADPARKIESRKVSVPLGKVDQVVVFGDATITSPAVAALLDQHAEICFLSAYGQWRGRLSPEFSKNSLLRIEQHKAHHDATRRFALARGFVIGKLANMRTLIMRANRKRGLAELDTAAQRIKLIIDQIEAMHSDVLSPPNPSRPQSESAEGVLMGLEGAGSAAYFDVFDQMLGEGWTFSKRTRRPPTDPVNALLSYAYSLLQHQVSAAVNIVGLDPFVGFLHSSQYGKPAMSLDVMEEFRPVIADSVALTVLNNGMFHPNDFVEEMGAFLLCDSARRTFLAKFEERLNTEIIHPIFKKRVTYRRCIEMQVRLVAKVLTAEIAVYPPFAAR